MKKIGKICVSLAFILCCLIGITVNAQAATTVDSGICGVDLTWTLDSNGKLTISGTGEMTDSTRYWQGGPWRDRNDITSVVIKSGVTGIGNYSFNKCENLVSVTIPESVKRIGEHAFEDCSSLKAVTISNGIINSTAFRDCDNLTTVKIGNGVTSIGEWAFYSCDNLETLSLGSKLKSIDSDAFGSCKKLTSVKFPTSLKSIGDEAFSYSGLKSLSIPKNITVIGKNAFSSSEITSAIISGGITELSDGMFANCKNLVSVEIPETVTKIGQYAFSECESLVSVNIPERVTSIDYMSFYQCKSLKEITIPKNVEKLGIWCFDSCEKLRKVFFTGEAPDIAYNSFNSVVSAIYYPKNKTSWTEIVQESYRGTLTWIPYTPLKITTQPKTAYALTGESAKVTVKAQGDGLTYQWYIKNAGASSYSKSSIKTASYSCKMSSTTNGRYVRCKITDKYGTSVWTNTVQLKKLVKASITTQPGNKIVKDGATAKFTVKATGSGLKYQWQYRTSSSASWKNTSATGSKTKTLSISATAAKHGYQYRCKITDVAGNMLYTKTVTMKVLGIKTQPVSKSVAAGKTAKFTVSATGSVLKYQWQYRTSSSGSWKTTSATGNKTKTLSISATTAKHGYQYRCKITDSAGNVIYTKAVSMYVLGIKTQPVNKSVREGAVAKFAVKATGNGLKYQWQYCASSSGSWKNVSAASGKKATYGLTAQDRHNGYQYRCRITDSAGNVIYSKTVKLTVK